MAVKETTKSPQAPAKEPRPSEFPDMLTWAAWLYYVDEITQSEVAERVGVSRVTVIKMLNEAKAKGIVSVRMSPDVASRTATSRALCEKFQLNSSLIIPEGPEARLVERLGKAGAFAVAETVREGDVIGIAWGRTVLAVARNVSLEQPIPNLTVVQVSASPNGMSADFSPELCTSLFANQLGARSVNLLAPAIVSSPELRALLLQEPTIRAQLDLIRSANKVVFGVGEITTGSTLRASELYSDKTVDALTKQGAVGVILGVFLDEHGREMSGPFQDRIIGITIDELRAIPKRLCIAGGPAKLRAIRAALSGNFATDLITDLPTALKLLDD
jgi:DNA-binding transcriptional regulator LsrR (DeoR family)